MSLPHPIGSVARTFATLALILAGSLALAAPASAAEGSIDHVEPTAGSVSILYSIPGIGTDAEPDLSSLAVTVNGEAVAASAALAADGGGAVRRTAVLAIDASNSMARDNRFDEAKLAAKAFLDTAPDDVYVGIVTFAGDVDVVVKPTTDRAAAASALDEITLSRATRLYDGVVAALDAAGATGQRSVLVLSDGNDTSNTSLSDVAGTVTKSDTKVDVVALAQTAAQEARLKQISDAGGGQILSAEDPEALTAFFSSEAQALASQVLITADLSKADVTEGTLGVTIDAAGETFADEAFVTLATADTPPAKTPAGVKLEPAPAPGFTISSELMLLGLGAAALGGLMLLLGIFGVLDRRNQESVEDRIGAYSRKAKQRKASELAASPGKATSGNLSASAVGMAQKALQGRSFEATLGLRLEAAGMALKPAEWLLAHAGIAVGFAMGGLLLSSGNIFIALGALAAGILLPWLFLGFKRSRRVKAFNSHLADTLQLMAGSLSAGLSLVQSVDTVVREGLEPIAGEFRRALIQARLGVEIEDAMEAVAERMESKDFEWVVMAIRIQRDVGGNLSELLKTVAATIREREYLHRQVQALSAEGRLSVWILGGLPPGFMAYLALANPEYLSPLVSTTLGFIMMGLMSVLLVVGIVWMKKLVKVEV